MTERMMFENLPNELLLCIFEYVPVQDLYRVFVGLNSRLTTVINSIRTFCLEQRQSDDINHAGFSDRVTTLIVRHSESIDLSHYPNLEGLKLEWPCEQQLEQMQRQSQLKHLYIGHALDETDNEQLIQHIFVNGFPQLRSCYFENMNRIQVIIRTSYVALPTLRSIQIFTVHSNDLIYILTSCPNLHRLSFMYVESATVDLDRFKQLLPSPHENLRTLKLESVSVLSVETIDSILIFVPNITYLSINNPRSLNAKINMMQMANSLHRRATKLNRFNAVIWLDDLDRRHVENIDVIPSFHPLFRQVKLSSGHGRLIISS